MGMFDYKNYTSAVAANLVAVSQKIALHSNASSFFGLPGSWIVNTADTLTGNWWYPNKVSVGIPEGWREVSPAEMNMAINSLDRNGYYTISSPVTGDRPLNGMGPQAHILVQEQDGVISKIAISWAGTNDILDIADYFRLNDGSLAPPMEPLLNAVKEFAIVNGLSGEDVIVTGYSLGGGMTNVMAKYRETLADGFFTDSDYIGHASPLIYDNADVIFNYGYKNDAVFRIIGSAETFWDAVGEMKPWLVNPDISYSTTTDNLILFTGAYSSPLWSQNSISMAIWNTVQGWAAHRGGVVSDAVERITNSAYYDLTNRDSRVIVDHLNGLKRLYTWVQDKTGDGKAAFILGNGHNNLLKSGATSDYIDAGDGNDHIKPGEGVDRIYGGEGIDKVTLHGTSQDYNAYRLSDGTVFMQSKANNGIKQLESIEQISFDNESFTGLRPYEVTESGLKSNRFLLKWRNQDVAYKQHIEGTDGSDELSGTVLFGRGGDDVLMAHKTKASLLHGGEGDDVLIGGKGSDTLYGAEGNDLIYGGGGHDKIYGGIGSDIFFFDKNSVGNTHIKDFNQFIGDNDTLVFTSDLFASKADVLKHSKELSNSVQIYKDSVAVYIENVTLADIENSVSIAFFG